MKQSAPLYIKILINLLALLDANQKLSFHPTYFLKNSFRDYAKKQSKYYQSFYNLLRHKYLEKKLFKGVESFNITRKGKYKALKYYLKEKPKQKWDDKWRIIFFDIPEERYYLRNRFRENLQLLGFKYLQKSAWVCPFDVRKELGIVVDYLNIHDYVHFAIVEKLENDEELKTKFKLLQ